MSGIRGLDLFPATGSGSLLSGLGRRQVGECRNRFRGHLCGYWPLRRRGLGGCSSRGRRRSRAWFQQELHGARSPGDIDNIRQVGERRIRFRGHLCGYWPLRRWGLGGCSSRGRRRSRAWFQLELYGARSPGDIDNIVIQLGTSKIFKRVKENLQCRLLLGSLLHPPGPSGNARCRR
jgi:hypothetical protein